MAVLAESTDPASETTSPVELIRSLGVLCEAPSGSHATIARALGFSDWVDASAYSEVFLFQLYPYASVHLGPEGMLGGSARDRVAGFWTAVGRTPPAEPDHLSALLGLYASLTEESRALADDAERTLAERSRGVLLSEHISPWIFAFLDRVHDLAGGVLAGWARMTAEVLGREVDRLGPAESLSRHIAESSGLPDPRREGASAFLEALLAPVRCGAILARADLARVALTHDVGLRAGERRYALEHLLGQAPGPVLRSLAEEIDRQGDAHHVRTGWLGPDSEVLESRSRASAQLLRQLADEPGLEGSIDA